MYEPKPPEDFNFDREVTSEETSQPLNVLERAQAENLSVKNVLSRQKQLQRLFIWLIGLGLGLGIIVAIGVVITLKKFGLADKPNERNNQPQQEQIQNDYLENLEVEEQ